MERKRVRIDDTVTEIRSKTRQSSHASRAQSTEYGPLIPAHILDEAFQRVLVLAIFMLIQAWKITELLNMYNGGDETMASLTKVTFVVKYCFIDGMVLWFLPVLNISYLSFTPIITLLLTLLINLFNIVLVSELNLSFLATLAGPWIGKLSSNKELTVAGDSINPQAIDIDSHFKGKYTIQFLPDSLAKFNVFGVEPGCQHIDDKQPFNIPIEFNTTTDIGYLELQYTSPENKVTYLSYRESDINKFLTKDNTHLRSHRKYVKDDYRVFYIEVPVTEPGSYTLSKVRDKAGLAMRFVQGKFAFAYCPDVSFNIPKSVGTNNKICVGSKLDDLSMKLPLMTFSGVPPLLATIAVNINGKLHSHLQTMVSIEALDTVKFNLTELFSHEITRNSLEQEIFKDPRVLNVRESSKVEFQIINVKDSLGNIKEYNPKSGSPDLRYKVDLLTQPSLRLIDMDSSRKLLINGTKSLSFAASKNIREQLPFTAHFGFEDGSESYNFSHTFKEFSDLQKGVTVGQSGVYSLLDAEGAYCNCEVQPNTVTIEQVLPPSLDIEAIPMVDNCVGTTGFNFKFHATGSAPFTVQYAVYHKNIHGSLRQLPGPNGRMVRLLKSDDLDFTFDYKPPGEGSYVIVFDSVKDYNYYEHPTLLDKSKHTYLTYFKQRSRISFFPESNQGIERTLDLCQGDAKGLGTVPIYFKGSLPFTFDYQVVDSRTNKPVISKTGQVSDQPNFSIGLNELTDGGVFTVKLSNVKDSNSCPADMNTKEKFTIVSRSDIPEVSFDVKNTVSYHKIIEGDTLEIPLKVKSSVGITGDDKIGIQYSSFESPEKVQERILSGSKALKINKLGIYKLSGFINGKCKGVVSEDKEIHVSYYPRPSLHVTADESVIDPSSTNDSLIITSGCQGCKRLAILKFEGKAPFVIDYLVKYPSGRIDNMVLTSDKSSMEIKLPTENSGLYEQRFKRVFDGLYSKSKPLDRDFVEKVVSYEVFAAPQISFQNSETIKICEASIGPGCSLLNSISIKSSSSIPVNLQLRLRGDKLDKTFKVKDFMGTRLNLNEAVDAKGEQVWKHLKQGDYEVRIIEVKDSNGCTTTSFDGTDTLSLVVTPAPDIQRLHPDKSYYCVGDHVGYNLKGEGPFKLFYEFNGKQHKATTSSQFRRLAARAGTISVSGVEDSSCLIQVDELTEKHETLKIPIHDLPSVEINHGDSVIQDIHEGDLTEMRFTFTGTPPFTVTYVRTLDANSKAKRSKNSKIHKSPEKIVETKTVSDIHDYEYTVFVGLEGTYEAIEIQDKYCRAKKDFVY